MTRVEPHATEALTRALTDRYTLKRELGRGGMATVYLAHDLRHDRPVALKVLHPELAATLGLERFLREIRLAARLQHPHILTVLVCTVQGFSHLTGEPNCALDWKLTFPPQPIPQALTLDVGHGVPQEPSGFTGVEYGQDVGVVEPCGEADFAKETLGS